MDIIKAAAAHFQRQELRSIEVPEWGDEAAPCVIYWRPFTVEERARLFRDADAKTDADVLLLKALDKDGKKLFTLEDKPKLLKFVDASVVLRIAQAILADIQVAAEAIEKN